MSARRPDISFEEAAAAVGIDPNSPEKWGEAKQVEVAAENKDHLARRVTLTIDCYGHFDRSLQMDVARVLASYVSAVLSGSAGNSASEQFHSTVNDANGELVGNLHMRVRAETFVVEGVQS